MRRLSLVLQGGLDATDPLQLAAGLVGLGIAAATAAGLVALVYRWYVREKVPTGLPVLFGLTVVALYLGTTGALGAVISGEEAVLDVGKVLPNLSAFAVGAGGSLLGIRAGDAIGTDLFAATGGRNVERDVSDIVQSVGRVTSVRLPSEINDIVGYDPMPDATKEKIADRRFLFPKRLRKTELEERLVSRLKTDYGVGHVDLELADDGSVEYIAIGSRAAGIGPTLPPATNAVAVRADPANAASAGDLVQVWESDPLRRVLTGELRGIAGDIVTVAIDASDTPKLDPTTEYKLVTLPVQDRPDREFASLLRAAAETMGTVTVTAGSELAGTTVGELGVTVAAIVREDEPPEPIPTRDRVLAAGDTIYAIARPEALRQTETIAARQRATDAGEPAADTDGPPGETSEQPSGGTAETTDDGTGRAAVEPEAGDDGPATAIPDAEASDSTVVDDETPDSEVSDDAETPDSEVSDSDEDSTSEPAGSDAEPPRVDEDGSDEPSDDRTVAESSTDAALSDDGAAAEPAGSAETPDEEPDGDAETPDEEQSGSAETPDEEPGGDAETPEEEPMRVWDPEEQLDPTDEGNTESESEWEGAVENQDEVGDVDEDGNDDEDPKSDETRP